MIKDTLEKAREPDLNLKAFLEDAYIHPIFKGGVYEKPIMDEESYPIIVATKRNSRVGSKVGSSEDSPQAFLGWWFTITNNSLFTLYHNIVVNLDFFVQIL